MLRFRGQQVPFNTFGPRMAAAIDRVPVGSFLLLLAPVLDGAPLVTTSETVTTTAPPAPAAEGAQPEEPVTTTTVVTKAVVYPPPATAGAPSIHDVIDIRGDGQAALPRERIPASALGAVPPALRVHYYPEAHAQGGEAEFYAYRPALRAWSGSDPLSRVVVSMWKGKNRCVK